MSESKKEKKSLEEREARGKIFNKIGLIILILLLCAVSFGFGFCSNLKIVNNTSNATSNQKKSSTSKDVEVVDKNGTTECESQGMTVENLDVTSPEVQNAIDKISYAINHYCGVWDAYSTKQIFNSNDFSNSLAFEMVISKFYSDGRKLEEGSEITKSEFDSKLASLLGSNYKFTEYKDQNVCPNYKWDETKQAWIQGVSGCGGTCGPHSMKRVVKAHKTDNSMTLYVRVIFVDYESDTYNYYGDAAKTKKLTDELEGYYDHSLKVVSESDANYNKGALYKLNFSKENDNYVFNSSELVG